MNKELLKIIESIKKSKPLSGVEYKILLCTLYKDAKDKSTIKGML
jgi:hypothetical protein